jgi:hypothetical protein
MKWFKHMTDDLDDPFVQGLIEEFGGDGYLVYFGTVSLLCRQQSKENLTGKFEFSVSFLRKKFQVSAKKLAKIYQFSETYLKLSCRFSEKKVSVSIPKILDIADDWTKKLRSSSEVTPKILPHEVRSKKLEVRSKKNIKTNTSTPKKEIPKLEMQISKDINQVFECWNSKPNLITHKDKSKFSENINARLNGGYSCLDLCWAIENLDFCIQSDKHYWTCDTWTLDQFLTQKNALDRFLESNKPKVRFLSKNQTKEPTEAELLELERVGLEKDNTAKVRLDYLYKHGSAALNKAVQQGVI